MSAVYKVELLIDNTWVISSWHNNEDYALANAEVLHNSRDCPTRVIFKGKVVYSRQ